MCNIMQYWLNGRTIEWIANRTGKTVEQVTQVIRKEWGKL